MARTKLSVSNKLNTDRVDCNRRKPAIVLPECFGHCSGSGRQESEGFRPPVNGKSSVLETF